MRTIIMKFGGAAVSCPESFARVAELILKKSIDYDRVVIVVSAMANMTDQLIELGRSVNPTPPQRELDMLISIGERVSISLLSMALHAKNAKAISFTGSQSGIITSCDHTQAKILDVRPHRIIQYLDLGYIVIVAGFQGVSSEKEITTLGRGGSDTSAVALGVSLDAEQVNFYKDVGGIFEEDPKRNPKARILPYLTYQEAMHLVDPVRAILHPRSIQLAAQNQIPLSVLSLNEGEEGTRIYTQAQKPPFSKIYEG